ncbi:MAG: sigma-70 family RNA polymerase sigma factor [Planctomycetota bacterium]
MIDPTSCSDEAERRDPTRPDDDVGAGTAVGQVYEQLHQLAEGFFRRQPKGHTLQPTALIHEAYLKLADQPGGRWKDRTHFLAVAATAMRQILVDHARGRVAARRGGGRQRITLDEAVLPSTDRDVDLLALDQALERLAGLDERKARVIELRFFAGLSVEETAAALGVSPITIKRDWSMARAWIERELEPERDS